MKGSLARALCASLLACPSCGERDSTSTPDVPTGITASTATETAPAAASSTSGGATGGRVMIETNTQATFGDVRIGVGNIWEEQYTNADGNPQTGLTAGLWVFERDPPKQRALRAQPGTTVTASSASFEVVRVTKSSVEIRVVGPGGR